MRRKFFTVAILLGALFLAALLSACGGEEAPAPEPTLPPVRSSLDFQIGNNIGDRIPEFDITLTDGTPITASLLLERERPAFLFFFGTT